MRRFGKTRSPFLALSLYLCAALSGTGGVAWADEKGLAQEAASADTLITPKVVYGIDDRIDVFEETALNRLMYAASTCALVTQSQLTDNGDFTFTLSTSAYSVAGKPPCEGEPFADQRTAANCSGFLVGPDIVVTAGHCYNTSHIPSTRFIFGFVMLSPTEQVTVFDASQIYQGVEVISQVFLISGEDYAVVRLDREVMLPEARPLAIRREGVVPVGTPLGVIGYPWGLPEKIAFGDQTRVMNTSNDIFFVANVDTFAGNSGSPVMNMATGVVEGVLVRGEPDFDVGVDCFFSSVLPDSAGGEESTKTTVFASFVPELDLGAGIISLDKAAYICSETIVVTVADINLLGMGTIGVTISTVSADDEDVVLTETGVDTGIYTGAIMTREGSPVVGSGVLDVVDGDIVTASYLDADDGMGMMIEVTAEAAIICVPELTVMPLSHNFGNVEVGSQSMTIFVVENTGSGLLVGEASATAPFAISAGFSYALAMGEGQDVTVVFEPTARGSFDGQLTFTGGGGAMAAVSGAGTLPPQMALNLENHDFGDVPVGTEVSVAFTVTNTGDGVLSGSATVAAPFSIVSGASFSLGGGEEQEIVVSFQPSGLGPLAGAVSFSSDGSLTVELTGTGVKLKKSFGCSATRTGGAGLSYGDAALLLIVLGLMAGKPRRPILHRV